MSGAAAVAPAPAAATAADSGKGKQKKPVRVPQVSTLCGRINRESSAVVKFSGADCYGAEVRLHYPFGLAVLPDSDEPEEAEVYSILIAERSGCCVRRYFPPSRLPPHGIRLASLKLGLAVVLPDVLPELLSIIVEYAMPQVPSDIAKLFVGRPPKPGVSPDPTTVQFGLVWNVYVHPSDSKRVFVSDSTCVRAVDFRTGTSEVSLVAGSDSIGFVDGTRDAARFSRVCGMALSPDDSSLLVCCQNNNAIRSVHIESGEVKTVAGGHVISSNAAGVGLKAMIHDPRFAVWDCATPVPRSRLYITCPKSIATYNSVTHELAFLTLPTVNPYGIACLRSGTVIVTCERTNAIYSVALNSNGFVTPIAGAGKAAFGGLRGIAIVETKNEFYAAVAEARTDVVKKVLLPAALRAP